MMDLLTVPDCVGRWVAVSTLTGVVEGLLEGYLLSADGELRSVQVRVIDLGVLYVPSTSIGWLRVVT